MFNYKRNSNFNPVYIRGHGPVVDFKPNRAFIQHAIEEFKINGGKIRHWKRVIGEPEGISHLFESKNRKKIQCRLKKEEKLM